MSIAGSGQKGKTEKKLNIIYKIISNKTIWHDVLLDYMHLLLISSRHIFSCLYFVSLKLGETFWI